jgi:GNAT superfamily N-acetyltransferase
LVLVLEKQSNLSFADIALARRLEQAEGHACAMFAESRRRQFAGSRAEWIRVAGAHVVFDSPDSPITQTFGLGMTEAVTPEALAEIEQFYRERGAAVSNEVSPLAGVAAVDLLCTRGYRPIELSSVMFRPVEEPASHVNPGIEAHLITPGEAELWTQISTQGWAGDHPELEAFLMDLGKVLTGREGLYCFLATADGVPAATGALSVHEGVTLFAGSSTLNQYRRRGLQAALLEARMRQAAQLGCDLAMMVAEAGSGSQRNAERQGFRIAYTRTKWTLATGPL